MLFVRLLRLTALAVLPTATSPAADAGAGSAALDARRAYRMVPHKTPRGDAALGRVKCFEGVPPPYDKTQRKVVPDCLRAMCLQQGHRYCRLGDLSSQACP
jgi:hypothetical protein